MSTKSRSPEEWISFLLTCMDYTPAKPDWKQIAIDTGAYKSGKFVNQAYANLRKKYEPLSGSVAAASSSVPATPRSTKKHTTVTVTDATDQGDDSDGEDDDDEGVQDKKTKRGRRGKTPRKQKLKKESGDDEDASDNDNNSAKKKRKTGALKVEQCEDELNGIATLDGDESRSSGQD